MVEFYDPIRKEKISYHIEPKLQKFLDNVVKKNLSKKDKDYVLVVDGYEGEGKTTFALQIGKYVDPTLDLDRVCMYPEEFKSAITNSQKNQCVIFDEAIKGMIAGDVITKVGKLLKSLMMQMRQKNLFVIVVLPTIFELNKYTILSRTKFFFHVFESSGNRGYFVGLNRKDTRMTYLKGKRTYSYTVRSPFKGRFYGKFVVNKEKYLEKKEKAFEDIEMEEESRFMHLIKARNTLIYEIYLFLNTAKEVHDKLIMANVSLSYKQVCKIIGKERERREKSLVTPLISI